MLRGGAYSLKRIKEYIREVYKAYLSIFIIHVKEATEYKKATFIFYLSNILYAVSGIMAIYFVSISTDLFSPAIGSLLLFSSYLMFDLSKLLRCERGVYSLKSLFFLYLPKPFPTPLLILPNLLNTLVLVGGELAIVIFIILFYFSSISPLNFILFFIFLLLGSIVFALIYNLMHFFSLSFFKQDNCPFCYLINELQDIFSKYPYDLFLSNKPLIFVVCLLLIPIYTYLPIKLFILSSLTDYQLFYIFLLYVFIIGVLVMACKLMYDHFLRVYETYGG